MCFPRTSTGQSSPSSEVQLHPDDLVQAGLGLTLTSQRGSFYHTSSSGARAPRLQGKEGEPPTQMATLRKERSNVRFAQGTCTPRARLSHVYVPALHRQVTERVPFSRLGHELNQLMEAGLGQAFDPEAKATAKMEVTEILDKVGT